MSRDISEQDVDAAFDDYVSADQTMDFGEMKDSLKDLTKGKRLASARSVETDVPHRAKKPASHEEPKTTTTRPNTRSASRSRPRGRSGRIRGSQRKIPEDQGDLLSSPLAGLVTNYPRDVPTADAVSQRTIEELSETSSVTHRMLEHEIAKNATLQARLDELYRSHNQLATGHEQLKSLVMRLAEESGGDKRGTTAIRSAKEVLHALPAARAPRSPATAAQMLPPELPTSRPNPAVASGGRPKHKPT